jgi:hypothetical protein
MPSIVGRLIVNAMMRKKYMVSGLGVKVVKLIAARIIPTAGRLLVAWKVAFTRKEIDIPYLRRVLYSVRNSWCRMLRSCCCRSIVRRLALTNFWVVRTKIPEQLLTRPLLRGSPMSNVNIRCEAYFIGPLVVSRMHSAMMRQ